MMRLFHLSGALVLLVPLLCGCMQNALPVVACGIDYNAQQYTLTLEGVRQDSLDGEAISVFLTTQADTLAQAYAQADLQLSHTLSFDHLEVVVFSESAYAMLDQTLPFLCDFAPPDTLLAMTQNSTAAQILAVEGVAEPITGLALSNLLAQDVPQVPTLCRYLYQAPSATVLQTPVPQVTLTADARVQIVSQEDAVHAS